MPSSAVTLFSGLAVKMALDDGLLDAFTRETGVVVETTYDPTNVLLERIADGARPDAMIGVAPQFAGLVADGIIAADSLRPIARTGIGLAAAPGTPVPDISDVDSLVTALISARSVAYSRTGASGVYFAGLIERLGIADRVNSRATVVDKGFTAHAVLDGRADLAVQQVSELLFVPEAALVGPLPEGAQEYTRFSIGLGAHATGDPGAVALRDRLSSAAATEAYLRTGLEAP